MLVMVLAGAVGVKSEGCPWRGKRGCSLLAGRHTAGVSAAASSGTVGIDPLSLPPLASICAACIPLH